MRKAALLVAVAAVLAIVVVTVSLSRTRARVDAAVAAARTELTRRAGLELRGGEAEIRYLPRPAVVVEGASIVTPKSANERVVADGGSIRVVPRVSDLLAGGGVVDRVEIEGVRFVLRPDRHQSATTIFALASGLHARVAVRDSVIVLDRTSADPEFDIRDVDLDLVRDDETVEFDGTMALLGARSHAEVKGTWRPGVGRTGGDAMQVDVRLRDGERDALEALVPSLRTDRIAGAISFDLSAQGLVGERSTEAVPAEPLSGRVRAEAPIDLFGLTQPAVFQGELAMDDKRYSVSDGRGTWGERGFDFTGWVARGEAPHKTGLRVGFEEIDVARLLADYGIDERWRPQASVSGELRVSNSLEQPLTRYEARAPSARFDGWPDVPVSTGAVSARGQLLVANAVVSASMNVTELKAAHVTIPKPLVGVRWWGDKLTVTSLGMRLWDGKIDSSVAWEPAVSEAVEGGAIFSDVDAATVLKELFPKAELEVDGRVDATAQVKFADGTLGYEGRIGLHDGTLGPPGLVRRIVAEAAAAVGGDNAVGGQLAERFGALTEGPLPFERAEAVYQRRGDDIAVTLIGLRSDGATLRGNATRDADGRVTGNVLVTLEPPLITELTSYVAPFAKLASAGGTVEIPARFEGSATELEVDVDPAFTAAIEEAAESDGPPTPFVAPVVPPLVELDLPSLEEQFAR